MSVQTLTEQTDPLCQSELTSAALLFDAPWRRYGVVGDSLSAGTGDPTPGYADKGWSDRVAEILRRVRPDLEYLNLARIGVTTDETVAHQLDRITEFGPDLLHLPSGANDIFRRTPDFERIEKATRLMYDRAAGTRALLTTFIPGRAFVVPTIADWDKRIRGMNAITRRVAAEYDAVVIDFWDHPVNDRENLLSADRIHFSTSGQAVIATEVVRRLAHILSTRR
ncbi:SGNH/GDSL hydrolase family protein [Nocardia concava]|uniref:SGNH/GDSL hydrolase family protein n=1 Tax=Nocardia concava TaxID=257281 RepID=UPI0005936A92|nr:SGNH/GDSL hydrolase family protein [Nocardia concava]